MRWYWEFLGGPEVKTSSSNAGDVGLFPDLGAKISHALGPPPPKTNNQTNKKNKTNKQKNIKWKQYCDKFNKNLNKRTCYRQKLNRTKRRKRNRPG